MDTNDKKKNLNLKNNNFIIYEDSENENEKKNENINMNIKNRVNNKDEYNSLYMSPGNSSDDSQTSYNPLG
jgi:hypothetical protein